MTQDVKKITNWNFLTHPDFKDFALARIKEGRYWQNTAFRIVIGTKTVGRFIGGVAYEIERVGTKMMEFLLLMDKLERERIEQGILLDHELLLLRDKLERERIEQGIPSDPDCPCECGGCEACLEADAKSWESVERRELARTS